LASLLALGCASSFPAMLLSGLWPAVAPAGKAYCTRWRRCSTVRKFAPPGGTAVASGGWGDERSLLAGKMLALGAVRWGNGAAAPGILLAGVAVFWLMNRQRRQSIA
ncbi:hypothetical protein UA70_20800, partial [Raoultella planticola]